MMIYCGKCGRKLGVNDRFCPTCGEKVHYSGGKPAPSQQGKPNSSPQGKPNPSPQGNSTKSPQPPQQEKSTADPGSVQYVYVNKKTGRIAGNPHVKTRSEGCLQFFAIALGALALVFLMVAGSVFLTGYLSRRSDGGNYWDWTEEEDSRPEVSSRAVSSETAPSEPVSSEPVSSETVSSQPSVPEELTADYLQQKIRGKWKTDISYKNMSLPGTFEFDGRGKCKCSVKAFLFSKKFEGTYTVKDGGECRLTLDGIGEYTKDDTMTGQLRFITDDSMEFTVEDTVWKLTRVE